MMASMGPAFACIAPLTMHLLHSKAHAQQCRRCHGLALPCILPVDCPFIPLSQSQGCAGHGLHFKVSQASSPAPSFALLHPPG